MPGTERSGTALAYDLSLDFVGQEMLVNPLLLPTARNVQLQQRQSVLDESALRAHDAAIIVCSRERALSALAQLPDSRVWQSLYRDAQRRGSLSCLTARVLDGARPVVLTLVKTSASAYERLSAGAKAWKELAGALPRRLLIATAELQESQIAPTVEAVVTAALAGSASMPALKSKPAPAARLAHITVLRGATEIDLRRTGAIDRGNHLARWLTTLPPNVLDTLSYRQALEQLAAQQGWDFSFLDVRKLKTLGAGAFLAVARANPHEHAGIARLRYRPRKDKQSSVLALVGKGICFDTGGINLKPHRSMYQMHEDMQGSAVAVGTLLTLSELKVPYAIDCWLALTENHIGPNAYRPQEIVTAVNGVTIQVVHSDAEGRMALADTLALAARENPKLIIDYATLTGACISALTERYSGAFTNRGEWRTTLELAGRESGERVWPFPLDDDFDSDLETPVADIMQCTLDSKGDHILAARFLNRFVPENIPWIHIDLAASNRSGGLAHIPTDFTGFGVRFSTHLLLENDLFAQDPAKPNTRARARS